MKRNKRQRLTHALPAVLRRGIERAERARKADILARPMRDMLGMLERGECYDADGIAVMRMPAIGEQPAAWAAIHPAIEGWIDCWHHIDASIDQHRLQVVADRLRDGKEVTPRLAQAAREEFERAVALIADLPAGVIENAIRTTQIAWEWQRIEKEAQG